jgi:Flp pilus assembly protein TadD
MGHIRLTVAAFAALMGVTTAAASVPDLPSHAPRKAPAKGPLKAPARHAPPAEPKTAAPSSATRAQVAELMSRGSALFNSRDWAGAIDAYNQAIALDPTNASAHYNLGMAAYWGVVDWAKAEAEIRAALSYDPKNKYYQESLATVVRRRAEEAVAEQRAQQARQLQAQQAQAQNAGTRAEAQQWFQRGDQLLTAGQYNDAVTAFMNGTSRDPTNAEAFNKEGIAYFRMSMYLLAEGSFRDALKLDPNNAQIRANLQVAQQAKSAREQQRQQTAQERAQQQQRDRNAQLFDNVAQGLALGSQIAAANRPPSRPAPQPTYSPAPRQYAASTPRPSAPAQSAPVQDWVANHAPAPGTCITLEKNVGGSFWSVVNNCPAAVIGDVCFVNDKTFNCGTQIPAGFGPIRAGSRGAIYGPSLQATAWRAKACYYDDWLKTNGCKF